MKTHDLDSQLEEYNNIMNSYKSRLNDRLDQSVEEYSTLMDDIKEKKEILEVKFNELKEKSSNSYEDLEIGFTMAADDLKIAIESAKERFK